MYTTFMKSMTSAPVFVKGCPGQFTPRILAVFDKLRKEGKDPLEEISKAYDYVDRQVRLRQRYSVDEEQVLKKGNPRKVGSFTWWVYLRKTTREIRQVLAMQKVEQATGVASS